MESHVFVLTYDMRIWYPYNHEDTPTETPDLFTLYSPVDSSTKRGRTLPEVPNTLLGSATEPAHMTREDYFRLRAASRYHVQKAIRLGHLPRLDGSIRCTDCPSPAVAYDHRDYRAPTRVNPVCLPCNRRRGTSYGYSSIDAKGRKGRGPDLWPRLKEYSLPTLPARYLLTVLREIVALHDAAPTTELAARRMKAEAKWAIDYIENRSRTIYTPRKPIANNTI